MSQQTDCTYIFLPEIRPFHPGIIIIGSLFVESSLAGCLATPQLWREIDWVGDWKDGRAAPPLQTSMARPIHQSEAGIAPRLRLIDFPAANHFLRIPNHQRLLLEMASFDEGQSISRHFYLFWGLLELDLRCPLHQKWHS